MNREAALGARATVPAVALALPRGLMRKCACGMHTGAGQCTECARKQVAHQSIGEHDVRKAALVESVVAAPGQPLSDDIRKTMEAGFGHDFGSVRLHTDAAAASSAASVDALAYTAGSHVVFGAGQYALHTQQGQHLLAHELAHVVQQRGANGNAAPAEHPQLEHEADRAAQRVQSGQAAGVGAHGVGGMMRQQAGKGTPPPAPSPPSRIPSTAEKKVIETARAAAAVRTQIAHFRTAGIGPSSPDKRDDLVALERRQRVTRLATQMFDWDPPNIDQVDEILSKMIGTLAPGADIQVAGVGDPDCGTRAGYVAGHRLPIMVCRGFFSENPEQQIRTLIHEAAHVAGIGNAALSESYCVIFDCEHGCGGFGSADSWAQYVHCLSGQAADKPIVIKGKAATPGSNASGGKP